MKAMHLQLGPFMNTDLKNVTIKTSDALRTIMREEGWHGFYKGFFPSLFLVNFLHFFFHNQITFLHLLLCNNNDVCLPTFFIGFDNMTLTLQVVRATYSCDYINELYK